MNDLEKIASILSTKLRGDITYSELKSSRDTENASKITKAVLREKRKYPQGDKLLPSTQAIQENLELVLYAERIPAVSLLLQAFFELGIGILVTNRDPVTLTERAINMPFCYDLEDSVKRLLLACRAGEWVNWDISKVLNLHGDTPIDDVI